MRAFMLSLVVVLLPLPTYAIGFGSTLFVGPNTLVLGPSTLVTNDGDNGTFERYPSVDLWFNENVTLQIHALELIEGLVNEQFMLGANVYATLQHFDAVGPLTGVLGVGGSAHVYSRTEFERWSFNILALGRAGFEFGNDIRFGVYISPGLGFAVVPKSGSGSRAEMAFSGTLQFSVFFP